jgi:aminoglycoside phosphotransferase (APT) family kinase protein
MEDCGDYRLGDQLIGCSPEDARHGVVEMGKLHAAFWDDVDHPEFDFIPFHRGSYHGNALRDGAAAGWDTVIANFPGVVPDWMVQAKDRYLAAIEPMQDWISEPPHTIVHGDFRMDNLFFGTRPEHHPMVILDWQGPLRCKPLHDLAYFLTQSLPVETRRSMERELVASWHATLADNGVTNYSAEQAWDEYLQAALYVWTVAVVIAGSLEPGNERGTAWMTKMLERNLATIDDHQLMDRLPS